MSGGQTLLLVLGLALLLIVVAIVAGVVIYRRRRAAAVRVATTSREQARPNYDRRAYDTTRNNPMRLTVGDLMEHPDFGSGVTYAVRGTLVIREGAYFWKEHLIDTGRGSREWVSVEEEDGEVSVIRWHTVVGTGLSDGPNRLTYEGVTYKRVEGGNATYTSEGTTSLSPNGKVKYADYKGTDGKWLAFERFDGGEWEVNLGQELDPRRLTITRV